jgi:trk system potassium uptake protein TrkA
MKYIVIGLGRFGSKLAALLTEQGHEVIGVDLHKERVDELKDIVTTVMIMDSTNQKGIISLPLNDIDAVIVAIGEDIGASILTLTILKSLNVKRIIGRAINQIHHDILRQIGVDEIFLPLEDSAREVAAKLQFENISRLTEISDDYFIAEINLPSMYLGHFLETIDLKGRFDLSLIAIKISSPESIVKNIFRSKYKVVMDFAPDRQMDKDDILIVAGRLNDIRRFMEG